MTQNVICVKCKTDYKVTGIGVEVFERLESGKIYKIWTGDKLECPGCHNVVIGKFAMVPFKTLGADASEIEAVAEAMAKSPEFEIVDWYPTSRNPTHEIVPASTIRMSAKAKDTE